MNITEISTAVRTAEQEISTETITVDNSLVSTVVKTLVGDECLDCIRKETFVTTKGKNKIVNVNKIEENGAETVVVTGNSYLNPIRNAWTVPDVSKLKGVFQDNDEAISCSLNKEKSSDGNTTTVKISRHDSSPILRTIMPRMFGYDITPDAADIDLTGTMVYDGKTGETNIECSSEISIKSGKLSTNMNVMVNDACEVFPKEIKTLYEKVSGESGTSNITINFSETGNIDIVKYVDGEESCKSTATITPSLTDRGEIGVQTDISNIWSNGDVSNETIVFFRDSINTVFAYRNVETSEAYTIVMNDGCVFLLEDEFVTGPSKYPKRFPFNCRSIIDVGETYQSEFNFDYTVTNVNFNSPSLDISKMYNYIAFGREYIKYMRMGCVENMSTRAKMCTYTPFIVGNIDLFSTKEFADKYARVFRLCGFISNHWIMRYTATHETKKTYDAFMSSAMNEWQNNVSQYILETICGESTAKNIKNNMECIMNNLGIVLD